MMPIARFFSATCVTMLMVAGPVSSGAVAGDEPVAGATAGHSLTMAGEVPDMLLALAAFPGDEPRMSVAPADGELQLATCWCEEFKSICVSFFADVCVEWLQQCVRQYCD